MFHDLQMMVYEDGGELIPMFNNFLDAASSTVRGFVPIPTFSLGGCEQRSAYGSTCSHGIRDARELRIYDAALRLGVAGDH
jgi:hypothetical protein